MADTPNEKRSYPFLLPFLLFTALLILIFILGKKNVDSVPPTPPSEQASPSEVQPKTPAQPKAPVSEKPKPSEKELSHAAAVLDFFNQAERSFAENWFTAADLLAFYVRIYLGEWQLAILPPSKVSKQESIRQQLPPKGLFSDELSTRLKSLVEKMSDALEAMLKDYRELSAYVQDPSIEDDGVKGKRLAKSLTKTYQRFLEAKKAYFHALEQEARPSEDLFLHDHPLKRQILSARKIFSLFREISALISAEKPDRMQLSELSCELRAEYEMAASPPFKDKAHKERVFRHFLRMVTRYQEDLCRGLDEGFFPETRKLLNDDLVNSRQAYNDFIRYLNEHN